MIKVSHLNKSFSGQKVLEDINLEIKEGEILVVLGPSGAGKSVLLKHLIGLMRPDSGMVEVNGWTMSNLSERELLKIRKNIGFLFQEGALFDSLNVHDNVAFPLEEHSQLDSRAIAEKVRGMLKMVGLEDASQKFPVELSGGMRKRAALARSVILGPKILCCDEPTSGLDPIRSRDISDLIRDVSREMKTTTVIASHDVANSLRIADRLALLGSKHLVLTGTRDDILKSEDPFVRSFFRIPTT